MKKFSNKLAKRLFLLFAYMAVVLAVPSQTSYAADAESVLRGRVSGQNETGDYLGMVPGATVELSDSAGKSVGKATANETGYYEITGLAPGHYTYKATATGYGDENAGRGFVVPADDQGFVHDIILSRGNDPPTEAGKLTGHVRWDQDGKHFALEDAKVSVRNISGGKVMTTQTDAEGAYVFDLPQGEWRVSAVIPDMDPQVNAGSVSVGPTKSADIDFLFSEVVGKAPKVAEVYALVSVETDVDSENKGTTPKVNFVDTKTGDIKEAKVTAVTGEHLGKVGLTTEGVFTGEFAWFDAKPAEPLPEGNYHVEGAMEGFSSEKSAAKNVESGETTWFDVAFIAKTLLPNGGEKMDPVLPGVRGRISGQTDKGDYIGIVNGAKIEVLDSAKKIVGTTTSNETGYYEIADIGVGTWQYRVTAADFGDEDAGRGFTLPKGAGMQVLDVILSKATDDKTMPGLIKGHVWRQKNGSEKMPISGALVTLRPFEGGAVSRLTTDAEGAYELSVPPAEWRASALSEKFEAKVHPSVFAVKEGSESVVDFLFSEKDIPDVPMTNDVYALVSVERLGGEKAGGTPVVEFVSITGGPKSPGTVRMIGDDELAGMGIIVGPSSMRIVDWYEAKPADPLPIGSYMAEGKLNKYVSDSSDPKEVKAEGATWFDVELAAVDSPPPPPPPPPPGGRALVRGRVSGQTEQGDYEGIVAGARVYFFNTGGGIVGSAIANQTGYYEIKNLQAGTYIYRVTGGNYSPEDAGRGFRLPSAVKSYTQDFILSRHVEGPDMPDPGEIFGHVWYDGEEGRMPVPNAQVMVVNTVTGGMAQAMTDEEGMYDFELPAAGWRVAAVVKDLGNQVHPAVVALKAGGEERVDLTFEPMLPEGAEIYIVAAVERLPNEQGDPPMLKLFFDDGGEEGLPVPNLKIESLGSNPKNSPFFQKHQLEMDEEMEGDWQYYLASLPEGLAPPGAYYAEGALKGYYPDMTDSRSAQAGWSTILDIMIERVRPEMKVLVQTKDHKPLPKVNLRFVNKTLGRALSEAQQDETGDAGTSEVMLDDGFGDYNVMAQAEGYEGQVRAINVNEDEVASLTITLFKKGEMRTVDFTGVVIEKMKEGTSDDDPPPVREASIVIKPTGGQELPSGIRFPLISSTDGGFNIKQMPEGDYAAAITAHGYKDWEGNFNVKVGMKLPESFELDPCNAELEDAIKQLLTSGWGKKDLSQRFHSAGVDADSEEARVDYAMALSMIQAQDWNSSYSSFKAGIKKSEAKNSWLDRTCEGYIWLIMNRNEGQMGATEIGRLVNAYYTSREATEASKETVFVFGVAAGVLNGPWNTEATKAQYAQLDRDVTAALKEPLRSSYVEGRNSVYNEYNKLSKAEGDATQQIMDTAGAEKKRMDDTAGREMTQNQTMMNGLNDQIKAMDANMIAQQRNYQTTEAGYQQQIQQQNQNNNMAMQRIQQGVAQIMARPSVCRNCQMENGGRSMQGCPACAAMSRKNQLDAQLFARQNAMQQGQNTKLQALLTTLTTTYNNTVADYQRRRKALFDDFTALDRKNKGLQGQMANVPDPTKLIANESKKFDDKKKAFSTYRTYPTEVRRNELLHGGCLCVEGGPGMPAAGGTLPQIKPSIITR